ncbi:neurogenic locus notch homolog protein 1-like [Uloborus diversus]|uniref:neurogenic locus notch homolog protein 1-like n=1 Tax=Uloborus diversus TaxID=327109 RepID=UPI0024092B03|nr:neurogenic locus notch homolog protein 1-like [Uloborus diversus]
MNCTCDAGYIQKDDICVDACSESKPCLNGGSCSNGVCSCKKGVSGNLCQIIVACDYDQLCGVHYDTTCVYDVQKEKAVCGCRNANQVFVNDEKKCRVQCKGAGDCQNGGECIKKEEGHFCQCKNGTSGDFCASAVCEEECFVGAYCKYDLKLQKSYCECKNKDDRPDPKQKACRKTCKLDTECKFGAKCTVSNNEKFCDCKNGTRGNFCEQCELCGDDSDVTCVQIVGGSIACVCQEKEKQFDRVTKTCRVPCESNDDCFYSSECSEKKNWYDDTPVEPGDKKYCRCFKGTSGDRCQIVDDCVPEKKTCGDGDDVECVYDTFRERAYCKCFDGEKAFHQIDKVCKDCNCGPYAKSCTFEEGIQICTCDRGYFQINNTCVECRCGPNSRSCMMLSGGRKMCLCERGYEDNGSECEECDCGAESDDCSFVDGKKSCICSLPTYIQNGGYCVRKCDATLSKCRNGGVCNPETRFCDCKKGTKGFRCEEIIDCEQFNICGGSTDLTCVYNELLEEAYCKCDNDLYEFDEQDMKCKECDCGAESDDCSFVDGKKSCICSLPTYIQNGGYCVRKCDATLSKCRNGGVCNPETRFCDCKKGTKGFRCEEIIDCEQFNICGGSTDLTCAYNEQLEEAYCKCDNDLYEFDEQDMKCKGAFGSGFTFMDDNAECHRTSMVNEFLEMEQICRIDGPSRSRDFKPIMYVGDALRRAVVTRNPFRGPSIACVV